MFKIKATFKNIGLLLTLLTFTAVIDFGKASIRRP